MRKKKKKNSKGKELTWEEERQSRGSPVLSPTPHVATMEKQRLRAGSAIQGSYVVGRNCTNSTIASHGLQKVGVAARNWTQLLWH